MRRKLLKCVALLAGALVLVLLALVGRAKWILGRNYAEVPPPSIRADPSAAAVRRGEMLFQSLCVECHGGADGRATGKYLAEVPAFLGTFYSANLAHPEHGVHRRSDGEIARTLRTGVLPDGSFSPVMTTFAALSDRDIAAILGYLRSRPPELEPAGTAQPRSEVSLVGELILTVVAGAAVDEHAAPVPMPEKAVTVEYGRYMAQVLDCVGCHTAGFSSDKMAHREALAGGFEFTDPTGTPIWSKNITLDPVTGIGRWSVDGFERAVTRGITPDGYLVRKPMPLFARLDRTDIEALYRFLQSMPKVQRHNQPGGSALQRAQPNDPPERLFVSVGCATCHGNGAPFRDKIRSAAGKTDAEVAAWILDPQAFKPGSSMPSFEHALDRAQAERLAKYVKTLAAASGG
jgi:mono/diheme cytochrome c family protein